MPDYSMGLFEDEKDDVSLKLFDDDTSLGLFTEEKPVIGEEQFYKVPRTEDMVPEEAKEESVKKFGTYPMFEDKSLTTPGERRYTPEQLGDEAMREMKEPLVDAELPAAGKIAASLAYVGVTFAPAGYAGMLMGFDEDPELDIPGEPGVGGNWTLKKANKWIEHVMSDVPAALMANDETAIKVMDATMGKLDGVFKNIGDQAEKTYLNQMEAGEIPYDRMLAANMGALGATVAEGLFWIGTPKFFHTIQGKIKATIKAGKLKEAKVLMEEVAKTLSAEEIANRKQAVRMIQQEAIDKQHYARKESVARLTDEKVTPYETRQELKDFWEKNLEEAERHADAMGVPKSDYVRFWEDTDLDLGGRGRKMTNVGMDLFKPEEGRAISGKAVEVPVERRKRPAIPVTKPAPGPPRLTNVTPKEFLTRVTDEKIDTTTGTNLAEEMKRKAGSVVETTGKKSLTIDKKTDTPLLTPADTSRGIAQHAGRKEIPATVQKRPTTPTTYPVTEAPKSTGVTSQEFLDKIKKQKENGITGKNLAEQMKRNAGNTSIPIQLNAAVGIIAGYDTDEEGNFSFNLGRAMVGTILAAGIFGGAEGAIFPKGKSFHGGSKVLPKSKLFEAQRLKRKGTKGLAIRKKTGWFQGKDGKWRYEISDRKMKLKPGYLVGKGILKSRIGQILNQTVKEYEGSVRYLKDVIEHPKLFEAYPELEGIKITLTEGAYTAAYYRGWDSTGDAIGFNPKRWDTKLPKYETHLKDTLIHEIQHAVQKIEDFTRGGSWELFRDIPEQYTQVAELASENMKQRGYALIRQYGSGARPDKWSVKEWNGRNTPEIPYAELDKTTQSDLDFLNTQAKEIAKFTFKPYALKPYGQYKRIAGEFEARDAAARRKMTAKERAKIEPYSSEFIPDNELIFIDSTGRRSVKEIASDINTILSERGSILSKDFNPEQKIAYARIKGDLKEFKIKAHRAGKSLERYLLDRNVDPAVVYALGNIAEDIIISENPIKKGKEPTATGIEVDGEFKTPRQEVASWEGGPTKKSGAKYRVEEVVRGLREHFHSPEEVFHFLDKKLGPTVYRMWDRADQTLNAFIYNQQTPIASYLKRNKIKKGSIDSKQIGKALDGKLKPEKLTPKQRKAYNMYKKAYVEQFEMLATHYAGSKSSYNKVARLAKQEKQISKEIFKTLSKGEKQAYKLLRSGKENYLPHLFDAEWLIADYKETIGKLNTKLTNEPNSPKNVRRLKDVKRLENNVSNLQGGGMVMYDQLPSKLRFKHEMKRTGKAGYSFDAVQAYDTYLVALARKMFYEPAIKESKLLHSKMNPELRDYHQWFVRDIMGWNKQRFDHISGMVASAQWMRTLGLNPRSALTNLTQRMNTIAEVGLNYSNKAGWFAYTPEGKALIKQLGIAREIPQVFFDSPVDFGAKMETVRMVSGVLFNLVERGNRNHAALAGYLYARDGRVSPGQAKRFGVRDWRDMTKAEQIQFGMDVMHRTQFRYGKIGMPKGLRTPLGRTAFQFWSFPIKQLELIHRWARYNPMKLVKWASMSIGGNYALKKWFDTDMSNALGIGMNFTEAVKLLASIPTGDFRKMIRQWHLTFMEGGGIFPSGLGPTATGIYKTIKASANGRAFQQLKKELTPVQYKRMKQAWLGIKNKQGERIPIYNSQKHLMYYVTQRELWQRTFGPRPNKESIDYHEWEKKRMFKQEYRGIMQDMVKAIVDGDTKEFNKLVNNYGLMPTEEQILNEIYRRQLTLEERNAMEAISKQDIYKMQQEGE